MRLALALLLLLTTSATADAYFAVNVIPPVGPDGGPEPATLRFNDRTGVFLGVDLNSPLCCPGLPPLLGWQTEVLGADGLIYEIRHNFIENPLPSGNRQDAIIRVTPTGEFVDIFAASDDPSGAPLFLSLAFAGDYLWVLHAQEGGIAGRVLGFDSAGQLTQLVIVPASLSPSQGGGGGNLDLSGMTVGPDGNLYLAGLHDPMIFRVDVGTAGVSIFASLFDLPPGRRDVFDDYGSGWAGITLVRERVPAPPAWALMALGVSVIGASLALRRKARA